jgi:hypothetical protein
MASQWHVWFFKGKGVMRNHLEGNEEQQNSKINKDQLSTTDERGGFNEKADKEEDKSNKEDNTSDFWETKPKERHFHGFMAVLLLGPSAEEKDHLALFVKTNPRSDEKRLRGWAIECKEAWNNNSREWAFHARHGAIDLTGPRNMTASEQTQVAMLEFLSNKQMGVAKESEMIGLKITLLIWFETELASLLVNAAQHRCRCLLCTNKGFGSWI